VPSVDEEPPPPLSAGGVGAEHKTRDPLPKVCPEWKAQQKIVWAEVLKETM